MSARKDGHCMPSILARSLLFASAKGNVQDVMKLLEQGATIAVNKHGRTALHIAAQKGFLDVVRSLLQAGCDPDIQDDNGDTALHRAVTCGNSKVVHRLLEESCDVDRQNSLGDTPLHEAARCGHQNIIKKLIKANANYYCKNKNLDSPLHMACANGHFSSAQQLLCTGSMLLAVNAQKDTPLHMAVRFGHANCARLLIALGCDVNYQNEYGNTSLHVATSSLQHKMVRLLLDGDAKAQEIVNKDGKTPIDIARDMENGELVIMLMSGARPTYSRHRRRSKTSPRKHRSHSESRFLDKKKSCSEECNAESSVYKNFMKKIGKVRQKQSLVDHQKELAVNPYVVPQLYSLHVDANGEIEQVPVLDRLPNPTPQIVAQLHQSIEEAEHVWEEKLKEATASFTRKIEELQNETRQRLHSLNLLTTQRIKAERTACLHRIGQRIICERQLYDAHSKASLPASACVPYTNMMQCDDQPKCSNRNTSDFCDHVRSYLHDRNIEKLENIASEVDGSSTIREYMETRPLETDLACARNRDQDHSHVHTSPRLPCYLSKLRCTHEKQERQIFKRAFHYPLPNFADAFPKRTAENVPLFDSGCFEFPPNLYSSPNTDSYRCDTPYQSTSFDHVDALLVRRFEDMTLEKADAV